MQAEPTSTRSVAVSLTPTATTPVSPPSIGPTGRFWLAVFQVAEEPDQLDALTERLAPVLGGALMVAPAACFTGLPGAAGSGYLLGAAATDRATLDGLVAATGETPRFVVRTRSGCVD